jgi:hypothetical protein
MKLEYVTETDGSENFERTEVPCNLPKDFSNETNDEILSEESDNDVTIKESKSKNKKA